MRKGFTILELLVASLLLGMLTTILTMLFTQSSVSWRLGTAMVSDMDDVRDNLAEIREEADNTFVWNNELRRIVSPWDDDGVLRKRACDADPGIEGNQKQKKWTPAALKKHNESTKFASTGNRKPWSNANLISIGQTASPEDYQTYTVNVMSGGPNNDIMDWQAIWSYPDDFD